MSVLSTIETKQLTNAIIANNTEDIDDLLYNLNKHVIIDTISIIFSTTFVNKDKYKKSVDYIIQKHLNNDTEKLFQQLFKQSINSNIDALIYIQETKRNKAGGMYNLLHGFLNVWRSRALEHNLQSIKNIKTILENSMNNSENDYDMYMILHIVYHEFDMKDAKIRDEYIEIASEFLNYIPIYRDWLIEPSFVLKSFHDLDTLYDLDATYQLFYRGIEIIHRTIKHLQNYKKNLHIIFLNIIENSTDASIEVAIDFLIKHKIKLSLTELVDNMNENFVYRREDEILKILKYIRHVLTLLEHNNNVEEIVETKKDIAEVYNYIFDGMEKYNDMYKMKNEPYRYLLLSIPLHIIKNYNVDLKLKNRLEYNDLIKIFYLNHQYLNEEDMFEVFYEKLSDVVGADYSTYQIEKDVVLNLFVYSIANIVEEYL